MPRRVRRPDPKAVPHIAAAHGTADTTLIAAALRSTAERDDVLETDREHLRVLATEYDWANRDRHELLRAAAANPRHGIKP